MALARLAHEGLVTRIPRRGTFVAKRLPVQQKVVDCVRMSGVAGLHEKASALAFIEDFTRFSENHGWTPRWHHVSGDEVERIRPLAERFDDSKAVVVFNGGPRELPWLLAQHGVPVVTMFLVSGGLGEDPACYHQITYDRGESVRRACEHLASVGYFRIAYVGADNSPLRTIGFVDFARRRELPLHSDWLMLRQGVDMSELRCQIRRVLDSNNRPQALCCATDGLAYAVKEMAEELGMKVPDDLAIIAADAGEPDLASQVGVTTVSVSREEICGKALETVEQLDLEPKPEFPPLRDLIMMPLHLTIKDSCGARLKGLQAPSGARTV